MPSAKNILWVAHNIFLVVLINNLNLLKNDNRVIVFFNLERIEKLNESRGLTKSGQNCNREGAISGQLWSGHLWEGLLSFLLHYA